MSCSDPSVCAPCEDRLEVRAGKSYALDVLADRREQMIVVPFANRHTCPGRAHKVFWPVRVEASCQDLNSADADQITSLDLT